jgi:hypothetical protein
MFLKVFKALILVSLAAACAQFAAAQPALSDPRNFDASQFGDYVNVGPNWLFAAGDNPAWASPAFDDSGWKNILTNRPLSDYGIHDISYAWYRVHIRLRPGTHGLMIGIAGLAGSYEVYANGLRLGGSGKMVGATLSAQYQLVTYGVPDSAIPESGELVLAVRCAVNRGSTQGRGMSTPLFYGSVYLLSQGSAPIFTSYVAAHIAGVPVLLCCLALLASLIAFALYLALKSQLEYLAIAVYLLLSSMTVALLIWLNLYTFSFPVFYLSYVVLSVETFALIEFVRLVLRQPRTRPLLILEIVSSGAFLLFPLRQLGIVSPEVNLAVFFLPVLILKVVLPVLLFRASRRGNREAGLLLPAILIGSFADYLSFVRDLLHYYFHDALLRFLPFSFNFGSYDVDWYRIGDFIFDIAILIFLVRRTVWIARERNRAEAELEAARMVQQMLIPDEIPSVPGFTLQSVYKPAGQVGGDFFQILPLPSGGVLMVIGDVSGKGMPAAMTVSLLVGTVRTLAHYTQSPGEILTAMNRRLLTRSCGGFTTCLVLRVDKDGKLTIANAGHLSPYLAGKELPLQNGLPLGVSADTAYIESTFQLAPSQQLTLLTDGIVEARDKMGVLFGFDRTAALSLQPAEAIAHAAEAFGQDDDITALTLARTA